MNEVADVIKKMAVQEAETDGTTKMEYLNVISEEECCKKCRRPSTMYGRQGVSHE